ncbi:unnamed protein product [Rotaria socialis]|uniref:Uncharacterized protein n=1 Tax=Rotaria socialis TaxID=392032 RepID=A0A821YE14_9BILA|nr:unnamed protein product [Rotaria socialis]CAF4643989.1 unnamed protein product [Rotaria socialis]CAF4957379.1 unnamed protein product [Rotaria socialis]
MMIEQEVNSYIQDDTMFVTVMTDFGDIATKDSITIRIEYHSELLTYIQRLLIQQEAERRAQQSIEIDIDEDIFLLSSSIVIEYFLSVGAN